MVPQEKQRKKIKTLASKNATKRPESWKIVNRNIEIIRSEKNVKQGIKRKPKRQISVRKIANALKKTRE